LPETGKALPRLEVPEANKEHLSLRMIK